MSSPGLKAIEVTFNKCLRRIWGLPPRTHTGILHCCAGFQSIYNTVFSRSHNFIQRARRSNNSLVKAVFNDILAYTFAGHNILFGSSYKKITPQMIKSVQVYCDRLFSRAFILM